MAEHDYTIANGTGLAVRTDINDALVAVVSQNSKATEPTTKFANMFWYDTSTNILKKRNAANTGWIDLLRINETDGTAAPAVSSDLAVTATGTVQGDAAAVGQHIIRITGGAANTGIIFANLDGVLARVTNATASVKKLYPGSGGAVDGGTTDEALEIPAGLTVWVFIDGADLWQ